MKNDFYSNAGDTARMLLGDLPDSDKREFINQFKLFVDSEGGVDAFPSGSIAIKIFISGRRKHGRK